MSELEKPEVVVVTAPLFDGKPLPVEPAKKAVEVELTEKLAEQPLCHFRIGGFCIYIAKKVKP